VANFSNAEKVKATVQSGVRTNVDAGKTDSGHTRPGFISSAVEYGVGGALTFVALLTIFFHPLVPTWLYTRLDIMALNHPTREGEATIKRRTRLGFSFTLAFLPLAGIIVLRLQQSNSIVTVQSLNPTMPIVPITRKIAVQLRFPLMRDTTNNSRSVCSLGGGRTEDVKSQGFACATGPSLDPATCSFVGLECTLATEASVVFSMAWSTRWVEWEVASDTGDGEPTASVVRYVKGSVIPGDGEILQNKTTVALQSMAALHNDTTKPEDRRYSTGFHVFPLPYVPPTILRVNDSVNFGSNIATDDWELALILHRSPLVFTTQLSVKQSPFQLAASILATFVSILATWRLVFKTTERLLTKCKCGDKAMRTTPQDAAELSGEVKVNDDETQGNVESGDVNSKSRIQLTVLNEGGRATSVNLDGTTRSNPFESGGRTSSVVMNPACSAAAETGAAGSDGDVVTTTEI
jgi:hypothetical protein